MDSSLECKHHSHLLVTYVELDRMFCKIVKCDEIVDHDPSSAISAKDTLFIQVDNKILICKVMLTSSNEATLVNFEKDYRQALRSSELKYPIIREDASGKPMFVLGPNGTEIQDCCMKQINWRNCEIATCCLLYAVFGADTIATHCLTGKNILGLQLDPKKVEDIVYIVMIKLNVRKTEVLDEMKRRCNLEYLRCRTQMKNLRKQFRKRSSK